VTEYRFEPEGYLDWARQDIPCYDELQIETARATEGVRARRILELGTGTGETARHVLMRHPEARIVAVDISGEMMSEARRTLPASQVEAVLIQALSDPLPPGPFELVFSALAVHHLDGAEKQRLFRRIAGELSPGGRFVLADVVVPERPEEAEIPLTEGYDLPDSLEAQLDWLERIGFAAEVTWGRKDLAVVSAVLRI
jgi:tRNA (cmo5U34)-methyltransferase